MILSIIVPLYNEEENVSPLYELLSRELRQLSIDYEILFVDDGSKDNTFHAAFTLAEHDPRLRIIRFRTNCGQTPAMAAGIDNARGDILLTMDGDLQNDPADIPEFLRKINEGYDIVVGWRFDRKDKLLTRKIPSQLANWLIGKITGIPIKDNGCSLKAYRARVIKSIPLYAEMHRFIPAMTSLAGARLAEIKVRHHRRKYGESKYGLSRIYKVLLDLLTIKTIVSFAAKPLLWFSILALPPAIVSAAGITYSMYAVVGHHSAFSVPIAGTAVLFGALALVLLLGGMLAELTYRTGDVRLEKLSFLTLDSLHSVSHDYESSATTGRGQNE